MGEINLWKEEYRIGHEEIDAQHKELFEKIESLMSIAMGGDVESEKKDCLEITQFLESYTEHHFNTEEAYQKEIGYVSYIEHSKIHDQFKNTVRVYKEKIENEFSEEILKKFVGTMMTWLMMHVCGCDRRIASNEPLAADITFEDADDLIREVTIQFLADTYSIGIRSARTSVYNGYIEGKVIVRKIIGGDKSHVFLFGFSEELVQELYCKISGMKISDVNALNEIEESALSEIADMLSARAMAYVNKDERTNFNWESDIFVDEYTDSRFEISNSVMLDFDTECGELEIIYCLAD